MLDILLRYQSESRNLISVIGDEVLKRVSVVIRDFIGGQAGRHGGKESSFCEYIATKETERSEKELSELGDPIIRIRDLMMRIRWHPVEKFLGPEVVTKFVF